MGFTDLFGDRNFQCEFRFDCSTVHPALRAAMTVAFMSSTGDPFRLY
ncbi:hypothetical protein [Mycolicibacillus koreensis]|nr:hypothetical protein [Mycolicibacillus koreensis]